MNNDAKNALVSYRMKRAAESLEAARLMLDNDMLTSAMNRIYYGRNNDDRLDSKGDDAGDPFTRHINVHSVKGGIA